MHVDHSRIELPSADRPAAAKIGERLAYSLALVVFVALLTYLGRKGYIDPEDDSVSLLDAFYYATVSITTTGYGDVRPVSDEARLVTTLLVTPARILFLILLVGTTLEVLTEHTRQAFRVGRWRRRLKDHIVICGYGTKGRSAGVELLGRGVDPRQVVVIERNDEARRQAASLGFAAVAGDASSTEILDAAGIREAASIVVAVDRDDAAVLITITARELNTRATIAAAVREEENAHLLNQSGADSVITSSGAAGRLLGVATQTPRVVQVLEDLLTGGEGLDIGQRPIEPHEAGPLSEVHSRWPVVAVVRGGELLRFDDPRCHTLEPGDELIYLRTHD